MTGIDRETPEQYALRTGLPPLHLLGKGGRPPVPAGYVVCGLDDGAMHWRDYDPRPMLAKEVRAMGNGHVSELRLRLANVRESHGLPRWPGLASEDAWGLSSWPS